MLNKLISSLVYRFDIKPHIDALQKVLPDAKIHPCGSRYVCSPPVLFTDVDLLVYVALGHFQVLHAEGYRHTTHLDKYPGNCNFTTWRKGIVNLIVSADLEFIEGFHTGTYLCKKHNIRSKDARILIHAAFRKNEYYPSKVATARMPVEVKTLLDTFNGTHGYAMLKAYRAQQGLVV